MVCYKTHKNNLKCEMEKGRDYCKVRFMTGALCSSAPHGQGHSGSA